MNRGHLLQSSPVQQMMAGSPPNWWNLMNSMRPPSQQASASSSFLGSPPHPPNLLIPHSQFLPPPTWASEYHHHNQELPPESWSQLLLGRLVGEEQKVGLQAKKLENWEEQLLLQQQQQQQTPNMVDHLKHENSGGNEYNIYSHENAELIQASAKPTWSHQMMPVSSPASCVTTLSSSNMLDFSSNNNNNNKSDHGRHPLPDRSSECNSTATIGGVAKKARVQPSSSQSSFKVRKEKLGDRITALHQLVSPFGKTDTASVLLEAIGYIRFLQGQIEALSVPYLDNSKSGGDDVRQRQHIQGGERNSLFPEDPGQLLNDNCMKRRARSDQDYCEEEPQKKDLRSRGLCLVPLSCTMHVGSENGADYWAPALGASSR